MTYYDLMKKDPDCEMLARGLSPYDVGYTFTCSYCGEQFHDGEGGYAFYHMYVCEDCLPDYYEDAAHRIAKDFIESDEDTESDFYEWWWSGFSKREKTLLLKELYENYEKDKAQTEYEWVSDEAMFPSWVNKEEGEKL